MTDEEALKQLGNCSGSLMSYDEAISVATRALREKVEAKKPDVHCRGPYEGVCDKHFSGVCPACGQRDHRDEKKPPRPSLEEMESELRVPFPVVIHFGEPRHHESSHREKICLSDADVLKALREVVVPRLKEMESGFFRGDDRTAYSAMLKALGEDVG